MNCPHCSSSKTVKNGHYKARQRWKCRDCGKTSLEPSGNPTGRPRAGDEPMTGTERMRVTRARRGQTSDVNQKYGFRSKARAEIAIRGFWDDTEFINVVLERRGFIPADGCEMDEYLTEAAKIPSSVWKTIMLLS